MITGMGDASIVTLSLRVYSVLLASYPQSFRQEYAPHMLQAFGDYTRRVYLQRGLPGMLWWWTLTLFDFLNTVMEEHLQRITSMTKEKFIRLGGWALMLGGLVMIVSFGASQFYDTFGRTPAYQVIFEGVLWMATPLLFATGYAALRSQYREQLGSLGNFSLIAGVAAGLIGFTGMLAGTILKLDDIGWSFFIFSILSIALVMSLFGIDNLRQRYLPRFGSFPLIAGLPIPLLWVLQLALEDRPWAETGVEPFFGIAFAIFSIVTILIGYMLQGEGKAAEEAS